MIVGTIPSHQTNVCTAVTSLLKSQSNDNDKTVLIQRKGVFIQVGARNYKKFRRFDHIIEMLNLNEKYLKYICSIVFQK